MSLRDQLRDILPQILPPNPSDAIKGTELIRLVRFRLGDEYSDATLRYHFSILSYDPASPIAKVDQGQGYYLRLGKSDARNGSSSQGYFDGMGHVDDLTRTRLARFFAVVERHCLHESRYIFPLISQAHDAWELPDVVITDWDFEAGQDDNPRLDQSLMSLKRHLGASAVALTAANLQISVSPESCRADFFKAVSATGWANVGQILIAEPVNDEALVETLRALGHQHGISITSYGLQADLLDELPSPDEIRRLNAAQFESLENMLKIQPITVGTHRPALDWPQLSRLRKHEAINAMLAWLNECLEQRQPAPAVR